MINHEHREIKTIMITCQSTVYINHCRNSECTQVIMGTLVVVALGRLEGNEWRVGVFGNISIISLSMKERHIGL